ncbi:uncharacterized protein LOC143178378 isoform X2 [Calliopsis andreniformis]|uniref:uncharacterized protein LOC143178378 isoform X2 n=1 Tax=Calliopsis andreniformis TaxID=337506 RepID=UPI003FCC84AC
MVLTVTEDTPADMLAGSMELLVQLPRGNHHQTQRVTVQRSTPMMDLLVQIATAHKLTASSYTLQAIGDRGMVLPHQPNTPIGALDALQVKLLPKQGTFLPKKIKQTNQPFETTFRLQVRLPRNQLYVSRVSPKMNLGEILEEVCREKNLDKNKYELRHPANLEETLDLSLSLQDYHLQEVTLYAKQERALGSALSTQDIMALQRQEERRRQQAKQSVFSFVFKKSKEGSLSTDSLGGRSASPARSDETGRSTSPLQPPTRPQRKRRPAPKPPVQAQPEVSNSSEENTEDSNKDKMMISHSRNSSDSSGYHEASVLSDNLDSAGRLPETLPRRNRIPTEAPRKLAQTSQSSKSLSNLASVSGLRKKRAAPPPPVTRPLSSAISTQALERIVDSEESLTSDMDPSKPPSDISAPSKANSDIEEPPKANSDIGVATVSTKLSPIMDLTKPESMNRDEEIKACKLDVESRHRSESINAKLLNDKPGNIAPVEDVPVDGRVPRKKVGEPVPLPKPRNTSTTGSTSMRPQVPKRKLAPPSPLSRSLSSNSNNVDRLSNISAHSRSGSFASDSSSHVADELSDNTVRIEWSRRNSTTFDEKIHITSKVDATSNCSTSEDEVFLTSKVDPTQTFFDHNSIISKENADSLEMIAKDENDMVTNERKLSIDEIRNKNQNITSSTTDNSDQEKKFCAIISTVPKCEHLDVLTENKHLLSTVEKNKPTQGKENMRNKADINDMRVQNKDPKRTKIARTASKSNDFEINMLEKQKRHLTSHGEDITFALNLNVASNVGLEPEKEQDTNHQNIGGQKSHHGLIVSDTKLLETDDLLQKVSDTLSNSLPVSSSNDELVENPEITNITKETDHSNTKKSVKEQNLKQQDNNFPDSTLADTSTPNLTVNLQQDTSDYVSATDEDLLIADWEYQLPAPPSAFRDSVSPDFNSFEKVILSPETVKDPEIAKTEDEVLHKDLKKPLEKQESLTEKKELKESKKGIQEKPLRQQRSDSSLKKEVIYELENKISTLPQGMKDVEFKRTTENSYIPKIVSTDNTLSNFTITTYTRQKSLNIFEENEQQICGRDSDNRFIRGFATLSRSKSCFEESENKNRRDFSAGKQTVNTSEDDDNKLEPKTETESLQRWQTDNEKSNIHRSKSYLSVSEQHKFQNSSSEDKDTKSSRNSEKVEDIGMKKAVSITNLNTTTTKNNEKFSQWRETILKRQEEPTKEKQLQSLQVLKSILPQLKNAQQAEENISKESDETVLLGKTRSKTVSNEHSVESNVVSTRNTKAAPNFEKLELESKKSSVVEMNTKRYTYSGPPMISLGSWSERPTVNVQIKVDKDYKLGTNKNSSKTIVNMSCTKDERDSSTSHENSTNLQKVFDRDNKLETKVEPLTLEKSEPNELAKKLITHTTASGFKKKVPNKIISEPKTMNDKPVVTGVELKRNFLENKQDNNVIDTSPVNFGELSKAFGEDVCLRSKPKRFVLNRHSDLQLENNSNKQNEHVDPDKINVSIDQCLTNGGQKSNLKKFTSVVGMHSQNQGSFAFKNGINIKNNQPMPVVKGFKISTTIIDQNQNNAKEPSKEYTKEISKEILNGIPKPPKPPTMPVITGVTLKNVRPKSMPVEIDPRDILLESIRNFGGCKNLKNAAERC